MPELPPEIEPTVLAILEARMKEVRAAAPAASERVKASAVKHRGRRGSLGEGEPLPGIERIKSCGSLVVPPTRTPARPSSDSSRPASSPVTGASVLGQAADESELRGHKPRLRERIAP
jgi:hypothetical protein